MRVEVDLMKRAFLIILALCAVLLLCSCGEPSEKELAQQAKQRTEAESLIEQGKYDEAVEILEEIKKPADETKELLERSKQEQKLAPFTQEADSLAAEGKYAEAIAVLENCGINNDTVAAHIKRLKAEKLAIETKEAETLAQFKPLMAGYYYPEALTLLNNSGLKTAAIEAAKAEVNAAQQSLVKYTGQTYHVFFHSLIIDTDLAFDNKGHSADGYNQWMTTVSEFKKMLPTFLEQGYVLYDITWMCDKKDGQVIAQDIYLPEGKKPLVISIDDVNYYDYMRTDGFAQRLDLDENGKVGTIVVGKDGKEMLTYDGDVMPILDAFVEEHPEFSFRGAKGIVALTGYQGAFGYRITDPEDYTDEQNAYMQNKVSEIAAALRKSGWQIACHSYTHNQYWNTKKITMSQLESDLTRWQKYIATYVGETNILISPFGVAFKDGDERMKYIVEQGFYIYCPVGASMGSVFYETFMSQARLNLDGLTMIKYPERISKHFFEPSTLLDPARPKMK